MGGVLLSLSQAMACTVNTAPHSTVQPLLQLKNNTLFLLLFSFFSHFCWLLLLIARTNLFTSCSPPPCPSRCSLSLARLFPESLRWLLATQHYRRSKAMMLRIARKNQVNLNTEPRGVLTGEGHQTRGPILSLFALFTLLCQLFPTVICVMTQPLLSL